MPVVAYPLDGTPEVVINNETGLLVQKETPQAVADAILAMLRNPAWAHEMGRAGQQRVQRDFDWHAMADILEKDYMRHVPRELKGDIEND